MRLLFVFNLVLIINSVNGKYSKQSNRGNTLKSSSVEYYTNPGHYIKIPVVIHFDNVLTRRLAMERKTKIVKKLMGISNSILKEVESYYRHLNYNISFSLKNTMFLKNKTLKYDENASNYLRKYCTWQGSQKARKMDWWYSILLTGADLYYLNKNGKEIRSGTGRSYLGGICAINKSCSVVEWNPKNMGYLIAHEIGHSLGMNHDDPSHNSCRPHINIMSNKYHPYHQPKTWSQCSRRDLQRFLLSRKSWCLRSINIKRGNKWN